MAERAAHELHPRTGLERFAPEPGAAPRVKVDQELYVVASTEDDEGAQQRASADDERRRARQAA